MSELAKYITHSGGKYTVHSESGKPMGTYDSEAGAKHRLQQIEYFKHVKKSIDILREAVFNLRKGDEAAALELMQMLQAMNVEVVNADEIEAANRKPKKLTKQEMDVAGLAMTREDLGVRHKPAPHKKLPNG